MILEFGEHWKRGGGGKVNNFRISKGSKVRGGCSYSLCSLKKSRDS